MDQIVDPRKREQMEYSAQFFGFSPDSFIDTLIGDCTEIVSGNLQANYQLSPNILHVVETLFNAMISFMHLFQSAKKRCLEAFEGKVLEGEVDKCFAEAEEKYLEATERIFYKFGLYLRSQVLTVPPEILLPEDEVHSDPERAQYDGADLHSAEDKFRNLCQKVRNAKLERAVLRNKVKNLEV